MNVEIILSLADILDLAGVGYFLVVELGGELGVLEDGIGQLAEAQLVCHSHYRGWD